MDGRWGDKYLPEFVCLPTTRALHYVVVGCDVPSTLMLACASERKRTLITQKKSPSMECYLSINPITTLIEQTKNRALIQTVHTVRAGSKSLLNKIFLTLLISFIFRYIHR